MVDALTASICIIDRDGVIRAENGAWQNFSMRNRGAGSYVGANYLEICGKASDGGCETALLFGTAIRDVLAGACDRFETEYPCHSPDEQRWFLARVTPFKAESGPGNRLSGAVITHQDITGTKLLQHELKRLADTDELTRLKNRRCLFDHIQSSAANLASGSTLALCLLDLDNFKEINDTSGHDAGDLVIRAAAERILLATSDMQSVIVARMGGDEFAVLLEVKRPWRVVPLVEKIFGLLSEPYSISNETVQSAASIGIAFYPLDAESPQSLLKAADLALYRAKHEGRSRYMFYTTALREEVAQRKALFNEARAGIARAEFETYFQPIVSLKDKALVGLEALVRWQHPEKGLLAPGQFLSVLNDRNLGTAVSQAVLLQVIQHLSKWRRDQLPVTRVSVNLTTDQLQNANFVEFLCRETAALGIEPDLIKLEITENVVVGEDTEQVCSVLTRLRSAGFLISLDDFGTGYASLTHMSQFPLDEIKIDMSFVRELSASRKARAVVRSVTHLAHELGLSVVAEGIEDAETEGIVTALGCDHGQGYVFGRPQPASVIPELIRQWDYASLAPRALPASNLRSSSK